MHHAELPIILLELRGVISQPQGLTILVVGGEDVVARVLSSLSCAFRSYAMLQIVNHRRPRGRSMPAELPA
jgi:hypothetical protein